MQLFTTDWSSCFPEIDDLTKAPPLSCAFVVLQNVVNAALVLAAFVAVFLITYAAFQYVTSAGDKEKVDTARKRITYAIIGLIVILFSFVIINTISRLTGVSPEQFGITN